MSLTDVDPSSADRPSGTPVDSSMNPVDPSVNPTTAVDPFSHEIRMTDFQWLRTYVLTAVLLPLRVMCLTVTIVLSWLLAMMCLKGREDTQKPFTGWRKAAQHLECFLGRMAFRFAGFHSVRIKGVRSSPDEAPILVVAPHSTFLDGFVVFWCGLPYIVSRVENKAIPFIGKCIEFSQALFVSRDERSSRENTVKEIIRRCNSEEKWPQLIIFPEGSTSNRKALLKFKPGAFYPAKPVQPVVIRYPNQVDTVTWTWNQSHGAATVAWLTMAQPASSAEIEFLDVYSPNEQERADPGLFARNVRAKMAAALGVPTHDVSYEEIKQRFKENKKEK